MILNIKAGIMRIITTIALLILPVLIMHAQNAKEQKNGKISYQSSENIYVTFESTEGMKAGDTILFSKKWVDEASNGY